MAGPAAHAALPTPIIYTTGIPNDGVTDASPGLNSLAQQIPDTGGTLYFLSGTYRLQSTVFLKANTTVSGSNATLTVDGTFTSVPPGTFLGNGSAMLSNVNWESATNFVDHDITIQNMSFVYGTNYAGRADVHAVHIRKATNVKVLNCTFEGGGDATALRACDTTLVDGCTAYNTHNACYDHWEGPLNAIVQNCSGVVAAYYGILFTGAGNAGTPTEYATGAHCTATNNLIQTTGTLPVGCGIWVGALNNGSSLSDIHVKGNTIISNDPASVFAGIGVTGNVTNSTIDGNTVQGALGTRAIYVSPEGSWNPYDLPQNFSILNNTILDAGCTSDSVALIQAVGNNGLCSGNRAYGVRPYPSLVWISKVSGTADDNLGFGYTGAKYNLTGATGYTVYDPETTMMQDVFSYTVGDINGHAPTYGPGAWNAYYSGTALISTSGSNALISTGGGTPGATGIAVADYAFTPQSNTLYTWNVTLSYAGYNATNADCWAGVGFSTLASGGYYASNPGCWVNIRPQTSSGNNPYTVIFRGNTALWTGTVAATNYTVPIKVTLTWDTGTSQVTYYINGHPQGTWTSGSISGQTFYAFFDGYQTGNIVKATTVSLTSTPSPAP